MKKRFLIAFLLSALFLPVFAHGEGEIVDFEGNSHNRSLPSWITAVDKKSVKKIEKAFALKNGVYRLWYGTAESRDLKAAELKGELNIKVQVVEDLTGKKASENDLLSMDISGLERLGKCWLKLEDDEGIEWYEVYSVYGMKNDVFMKHPKRNQNN